MSQLDDFAGGFAIAGQGPHAYIDAEPVFLPFIFIRMFTQMGAQSVEIKFKRFPGGRIIDQQGNGNIT